MSTATSVPASAHGWLRRWLVDGPDPVEESKQPRLLETLLPWPVRCLIVLAAFAAGWMWRDASVGRQLAWGLQYGALIAVAVLASFWWYAFLINAGLAALWFIPLQPRARSHGRWSFLHIVAFVNRQAGHLEALLVWIIIALSAWPWLPWQAAGLAAVLLVAPSILNGLARTMTWSWLGRPATSKDNGDLLWRRRLLIYAFTFIGLAVLCARAPGQASKIFPMIGAIFFGGLLPRAIRHYLRDRKVREELLLAGPERIYGREDQRELAVDQQNARAAFRAQQAVYARRGDLALGPLLALAAVTALLALSWRERQRLAAEERAALDGPAAPTGSCARDAHGPLAADVSLFLVSDWQVHDLAGERFPGQLSVADAINRTASRPVALNVLTEASVAHFGATYRALAGRRPADRPMRWAHLGDLADLSCRGELARVRRMMAAFGLETLAGVAFGNHEMSFTGTFHWSPFWDTACPTGRMEKDTATAALEEFLRPPVQKAGGDLARLEGTFFAPRGGSLVTVTPLGTTRHAGKERGVIAVFLDTTDGRAFDNGIPGSFGAISGDQLDRARALIAAERARDTPYHDPLYVLFSHHPSADLVGPSRDRLADFVAELDGRPPGNIEADPRVLALVAGHAHGASAHRRCLGGRVVRELVIGSTLDPPQQAAILEIGADVAGRAALRVRTLQSVSRPERSCDATDPEPAPARPVLPAVPAAECRRLAATLLGTAACKPLVGGRIDDPLPRDCSALERSIASHDKLRALRTDRGPIDPKAEYAAEEADARRLLACACRDGACTPEARPFADEAYGKLVAALVRRPDRQRELVCLAWAAAAQQAHKESGMTVGEALRCAFDDPTLPAEREAVAALEAVACR